MRIIASTTTKIFTTKVLPAFGLISAVIMLILKKASVGNRSFNLSDAQILNTVSHTVFYHLKPEPFTVSGCGLFYKFSEETY